MQSNIRAVLFLFLDMCFLQPFKREVPHRVRYPSSELMCLFFYCHTNDAWSDLIQYFLKKELLMKDKPCLQESLEE